MIDMRKSKGFTLVECIIAIAVFAVLTSMVIMIVGNTIKLSSEATEAEGDLNVVVQNVVQDNSKRVYGVDSKTLEMNIGSSATANFKMTYSSIDGDKNFIKCPLCGDVHNDLDYLAYIYNENAYKNWPTATEVAAGADASTKGSFKISYWFQYDSSTSGYKCPSCLNAFLPSAITGRCDSCEYQATMNNFSFDNVSGKYQCPVCKNESVVQMVSDGGAGLVPISATLRSDSQFSVSGITPNALRYGQVKQLKAEEIVDLSTITGTVDGTFNFTLEYHPNVINPTAAGSYILKINSVGSLDSAESATAVFALPPYYKCTLDTAGTNADGSTGHPSATVTTIDVTDPDDIINKSYITISGITTSSSNNIVVEFKLENYKSGSSFDDDYKVDAGVSGTVTALGRYWFGKNSNSITVPREESDVSLLPTT